MPTQKTAVPASPRIIFITTPNSDPWAGSEELWGRTALDLVAQGFPVSASVTAFSPLHPRMIELRNRGVELWLRPAWYAWHEHPWRRLRSRRGGPILHEAERLIAARPPALVVLSDGAGGLPPIELLELCVARRLAFATIVQLGRDTEWYADGLAERYRRALAAAQRCYFVSHANYRLAETQIAGDLPNGEVVWNPFNVPRDASPAWPPLGADRELRLACVGRLYPRQKGQDLLFEALASPVWRERPWRLSVYGEGPQRQTLERLAEKLGISDRVVFAGFARVEQIWAANHALVMPSRYEGLPLAMVEAMVCGRPVVATDVAGHAEIIEDGMTGFLADAPTAGSIAIALERFWERRDDAEAIGKAGARRIRELVPPDPVRIFSDKLRALVEKYPCDGAALQRRLA
ncbi:MAG TPA: glycosyltransferase family 4 protein [Stellaceae bacterium]|nr:glycosyltransferase family 4 protein [Stellaceae bacterium]